MSFYYCQLGPLLLSRFYKSKKCAGHIFIHCLFICILFYSWSRAVTIRSIHRPDSRFAPSQWETALHCNDVSHWLGANLESTRYSSWDSFISVLRCEERGYSDLFHYSDITCVPWRPKSPATSTLCSTACSVWHKKSSTLLALCERNSPVTDGFPSQRASNAESVSVSWRLHADGVFIKSQLIHRRTLRGNSPRTPHSNVNLTHHCDPRTNWRSRMLHPVLRRTN